MYEIVFYDDERGNEPIKEYIEKLNEKASTSKDARINLKKIVTYLDALEAYGTRVGEPVTKHLNGEIWELRPLANRILYAYWCDNKFILLHHFIKKVKQNSCAGNRAGKKEFGKLYRKVWWSQWQLNGAITEKR